MTESQASPVRVVIIDDSSAVRRLLKDILAADPEINVVGVAPDAVIALEKIKELKPDVITLDVEMPDVSGLELLARIRKLDTKIPVIMFSALTQRAAAITLEALALGATDYVTKPAQTGSREASATHVRDELIPKIKALGKVHRGVSPAVPKRSPVAVRASMAAPSVLVEVIAVGSSTGGPNALADLFQALPADLPVPILIAQHMPPVFTHLLAERLTAKGPLKFHEAKDGDVLKAGEAWIAPGNYHMRIERSGNQKRVRLDQSPPENSCRPAVDVLFRSVAEEYGKHAVAVILTGMGQDGLRGAEKLHAAGAKILAQDEASSVIWGMPGSVVRAGLADLVQPLNKIAAELTGRVSPRARGAVGAAGEAAWM